MTGIICVCWRVGQSHAKDYNYTSNWITVDAKYIKWEDYLELCWMNDQRRKEKIQKRN
jgi:hypothetical protein